MWCLLHNVGFHLISPAERGKQKQTEMAESGKREPPKLTQAELDTLAASLDICYAVWDNLTDGHATYQAALTICNKGKVLVVTLL